MSDNVTALPTGAANDPAQDANIPPKVNQPTPEQMQQHLFHCAKIVEVLQAMNSQDLRSAIAALRTFDPALQQAGARIQQLEDQVRELTGNSEQSDES